MGKSYTPTFRIVITSTKVTGAREAWNTKSYGRPTARTLEAYVRAFEASTHPGGCNQHLGPEVVFSARVERQSDGQVMARYSGPSFVVV